MNGAIGFVEDIVWPLDSERSDLPLAVLVSITTYTGPTLWRTEPRPGFPNGVPVVPITPMTTIFELHGKYNLARTHVPLRLAWAISIHKSQGMTLERAQIGLGKREFCVGLTFVALSRVKSLSGIMLVESLDFTRVRNLGGLSLQERLADFARRYPQPP